MEHTNTMEDTHTQESTQTREDRHTHEMHINESILSKEILEDQKKNRIDHMTYLPGMEDIGSEILDQVVEKMNAYDYDQYTAADVKRALAHSQRTPEDFQALLSPAALPYLEEIAQESILGTASICSLRSTLRITVKIIVFIVDLTAITRSTEQG